MIPRMPLSTGPLIGRDSYLSHLADAIGLRPTPGARPGGVVVLSGDAGIGKSRIVGQLVSDATAADWFTAVGHCVGQAGTASLPPGMRVIGTIDAGHPDVVERCSRRTRASGTCCRAHRRARPEARRAGHRPRRCSPRPSMPCCRRSVTC